MMFLLYSWHKLFVSYSLFSWSVLPEANQLYFFLRKANFSFIDSHYYLCVFNFINFHFLLSTLFGFAVYCILQLNSIFLVFWSISSINYEEMFVKISYIADLYISPWSLSFSVLAFLRHISSTQIYLSS